MAKNHSWRQVDSPEAPNFLPCCPLFSSLQSSLRRALLKSHVLWWQSSPLTSPCVRRRNQPVVVPKGSRFFTWQFCWDGGSWGCWRVPTKQEEERTMSACGVTKLFWAALGMWAIYFTRPVFWVILQNKTMRCRRTRRRLLQSMLNGLTRPWWNTGCTGAGDGCGVLKNWNKQKKKMLLSGLLMSGQPPHAKGFCWPKKCWRV